MSLGSFSIKMWSIMSVTVHDVVVCHNSLMALVTPDEAMRPRGQRLTAPPHTSPLRQIWSGARGEISMYQCSRTTPMPSSPCQLVQDGLVET